MTSLGPFSHLNGSRRAGSSQGRTGIRHRQPRSARPSGLHSTHSPAALPPGPWGAGSTGEVPRPICQGRYRQVRVPLSCWVGTRRAGRPVPGRRSNTPRPPARAFPGYTVPGARHTCARVCTDMDAHTSNAHTRTHIHTHMHTHVHTYTHTHTHPVHLSLTKPTQMPHGWPWRLPAGRAGGGGGVGVGAGGQSGPQADPHCLPLPRLDSGTAAQFVKPWRSGQPREAGGGQRRLSSPGALRRAACSAATLEHGFKASNPCS